jgi:hypothetical protein
MALMAFADSPPQMMAFCHRWGIGEPFARPVNVRCCRCEAVLHLAFICDAVLSNQDLRAVLALELLSRGWALGGPAQYCPACLPA